MMAKRAQPDSPETAVIFFRRGPTLVMAEVDRTHGWVVLGDDMNMEGLDSPARLRPDDIEPFMTWLREEVVPLTAGMKGGAS